MELFLGESGGGIGAGVVFGTLELRGKLCFEFVFEAGKLKVN